MYWGLFKYCDHQDECFTYESWTVYISTTFAVMTVVTCFLGIYFEMPPRKNPYLQPLPYYLASVVSAAFVLVSYPIVCNMEAYLGWSYYLFLAGWLPLMRFTYVRGHFQFGRYLTESLLAEEPDPTCSIKKQKSTKIKRKTKSKSARP